VSGANADVAQRALDTFNRAGIAATAPLVHPELEVHAFAEWPGPPVYRGMEGLTRLVDEWTQNFDDYTWQASRMIEDGERVVILADHGGRTRDGVAVRQPIGAIWWVRDGKVTRMDYFLSWNEALEAAGLGAEARQP
jgi:ketosteroid isomerase-like protein